MHRVGWSANPNVVRHGDVGVRTLIHPRVFALRLFSEKTKAFMLRAAKNRPKRHSGEGRNLCFVLAIDSGLRRNDGEEI